MTVAFLLLSCAKQPEPIVEPQPLPFNFDENLLLVDSLMQSDADSALRILLSMGKACLVPTGCHDSTSCTGKACLAANANNHYHSLLLSEALYKTYNPQLNRYRNETFREASLQDAMRYFDSVYSIYPTNDDLAMLSARSHYMNGVGFYENDSVVEACKEYLHTLDIIDNFNDKDLVGYKAKFMALTYNRLTDLFSSQFMMEPAIYCGKKAMFFCTIETTSKYGLANIIYHIGKNYDILGQIDSAYYYHKAIEQLPDSNNYIYRDIASNMAVLSYDADRNAEQSIDDFKIALARTDNEKEKLSRYIGIGYIYYNESNYDSAFLYLKYVFDHTSDKVLKLRTAGYLQNIYRSINDYNEADKYSKLIAQNALSKYDNMMDVSILNKLFDSYLEQLKYKQQYHNKKKTIYFIVAISVIITFIIILLIHLKNKKIKDTNRKYNKEKTKAIKLEKEIIRKRSTTELHIECFLNEPVCRKINNTICDIPASARSNYSNYTYLKLDEVTIIELGEAVTKHFPNLKTRLISNDIKLKKDDLLLCYLYLLGLNNSQIALLRQCNFATVCRQANRLKKSFTGCKDLPSFIKKIATD